MLIAVHIRIRQRQRAVVVHTLLPAARADALEGCAGPLGVHETPAVERDAHDDLVPREALRDVPVDGLGGADGAAMNVSLVLGDGVPRSSWVAGE